MKKFIDEFSTNVPFYLLSLYSLGYTYFKIYYYNFEIKIEYYVNLTDFIFFSIEILLLILLFFFIFQGALDIIFSLFYEKILFPFLVTIRRKKNTSKKLIFRFYSIYDKGGIYRNYLSFFFTIFFLAAFISIIFFNPPRGVYFAFPVISILFFTTNKNEDKKNIDYPMRYFGFMFFCIVGLGFLAKKDSNSVKEEYPQKLIEFSIDDVFYSTKNSEFNLIGETSNYVFLYNKETKESLTFNKSDISIIKTKIPDRKN